MRAGNLLSVILRDPGKYAITERLVRIACRHEVPPVFCKLQHSACIHVQALEALMSPSIKTLGIDRLTVDERLALVEEIWESIAAETDALPLTNAQRVELEQRIAEDDAQPEGVIPWEEIKSSTLCDPGE
jgi:putative addiction module component (TIGR02574 family)